MEERAELLEEDEHKENLEKLYEQLEEAQKQYDDADYKIE